MNKRHKEFFEQLGRELADENTKTTGNSRVLIVDGLNTYIRVFSVVPVVNDNGMHVGGISGFLRSIGYAIEITKPTRVIVVFDGKGGSARRRKLYPEYKERRTPVMRLNRSDLFMNKEEETKAFHHELVRVAKYLQALPVTMCFFDHVEADDVIAYITKVLPQESHSYIMSTDKDFFQLVSDRVSVWSPTKKKIYTPDLVKREYSIPPENMCLFRSINSKGDKSDNIRGVDGFGDKTIIKKLPMITERVVSIDEVFDYAKTQTDDTALQRLIENRKIVERNVQLMQLSDVDMSGTTKEHILELLRQPVEQSNKLVLFKMVNEDQLWAGIPNFDFWLRQHFLTLDQFAQFSKQKGVYE